MLLPHHKQGFTTLRFTSLRFTSVLGVSSRLVSSRVQYSMCISKNTATFEYQLAGGPRRRQHNTQQRLAQQLRSCSCSSWGTIHGSPSVLYWMLRAHFSWQRKPFDWRVQYMCIRVARVYSVLRTAAYSRIPANRVLFCSRFSPARTVRYATVLTSFHIAYPAQRRLSRTQIEREGARWAQCAVQCSAVAPAATGDGTRVGSSSGGRRRAALRISSLNYQRYCTLLSTLLYCLQGILPTRANCTALHCTLRCSALEYCTGSRVQCSEVKCARALCKCTVKQSGAERRSGQIVFGRWEERRWDEMREEIYVRKEESLSRSRRSGAQALYRTYK